MITLKEYTWEKITGTNFEILTNSCGELFIRYLTKHIKEPLGIRLTGTENSFTIIDHNTPGTATWKI